MTSTRKPPAHERETRAPGLAQEQGFRQGLSPVPTAVAVSKRPAAGSEVSIRVNIIA